MFDLDVFISYTHRDNRSEWISKLHQELEIRLSELLGRAVTVWRDSKLRGTDIALNETTQQLRNAAVMVVVVTPSWIRSVWCQKELSAFLDATAQQGGIMIGTELRVVKVVKTPIEEDRERTILPTTLWI